MTEIYGYEAYVFEALWLFEMAAAFIWKLISGIVVICIILASFPIGAFIVLMPIYVLLDGTTYYQVEKHSLFSLEQRRWISDNNMWIKPLGFINLILLLSWISTELFAP
jgi:hypothetical protein